MTEILRDQGEIEDVKHQGAMIARREALAHKMWALALSGKPEVMRYMYDRIDGKPVQEVKVRTDAAIDAPVYLIVGAPVEVVDGNEAEDEASTLPGNDAEG
jgi:hypothetical protein